MTCYFVSFNRSLTFYLLKDFSMKIFYLNFLHKNYLKIFLSLYQNLFKKRNRQNHWIGPYCFLMLFYLRFEILLIEEVADLHLVHYLFPLTYYFLNIYSVYHNLDLFYRIYLMIQYFFIYLYLFFIFKFLKFYLHKTLSL